VKKERVKIETVKRELGRASVIMCCKVMVMITTEVAQVQVIKKISGLEKAVLNMTVLSFLKTVVTKIKINTSHK
jgi:hypothetical protein